MMPAVTERNGRSCSTPSGPSSNIAFPFCLVVWAKPVLMPSAHRPVPDNLAYGLRRCLSSGQSRTGRSGGEEPVADECSKRRNDEHEHLAALRRQVETHDIDSEREQAEDHRAGQHRDEQFEREPAATRAPLCALADHTAGEPSKQRTADEAPRCLERDA